MNRLTTVIYAYGLMGLACIFCIITLLHGKIIDDSFITYRYAWNLVHGNGLVFNKGEHVEGITSLTWTLISALILALKLNISKVTPYLGLCLSLAAVAISIKASRKAGAGNLIIILCAVPLLANEHFWLASRNGMETALAIFLVALTFQQFLLGRYWICVCLTPLLYLTHPELVAYYPLLALTHLLGERYRGIAITSTPLTISAFSRQILVIGFMLTTIELARYHYYDSLLPNSMMAKTGYNLTFIQAIGQAIRGLDYLAGFFFSFPIILALFAALLIVRETKLLLISFVPFAFQLMVVVTNGGDWTHHFRLLIPFILPLLVSMSAWLSTVAPANDQLKPWLPGVSVLFLSLNMFHITPLIIASKSLQSPSCNRYIANSIRPYIQTNTTLSVEAIGQISYLYPTHYFHDFLGLTDRHIALHGNYFHPQYGKSDYRYTVDTIAPDIIITHSGDNHLRLMDYFSSGHFSSNYIRTTLKAPGVCQREGKVIRIAIKKGGHVSPGIFSILRRL